MLQLTYQNYTITILNILSMLSTTCLVRIYRAFRIVAIPWCSRLRDGAACLEDQTHLRTPSGEKINAHGYKNQ